MVKYRDTRYFRFSYNPSAMEEYYESFAEMIQSNFDHSKNDEKYREDFKTKFSFALHFYEDYNHVEIEADQDVIDYYSNIFIDKVGFISVDDKDFPKNASLGTVFCFEMSNRDLPSKYKEVNMIKGVIIT